MMYNPIAGTTSILAYAGNGEVVAAAGRQAGRQYQQHAAVQQEDFIKLN